MFVQRLIQVNKKGETLHYVVIVWRIHQWPVDFPHKGPMMENVSMQIKLILHLDITSGFIYNFVLSYELCYRCKGDIFNTRSIADESTKPEPLWCINFSLDICNIYLHTYIYIYILIMGSIAFELHNQTSGNLNHWVCGTSEACQVEPAGNYPVFQWMASDPTMWPVVTSHPHLLWWYWHPSVD